MDLSLYSATLALDHEGIWRGAASTVSYPEGGNASCFRIEDDSYWFGHRNEVIADLVRRHPPRGPIFDVGAGNGFVALGLTAAGFETVAVEPGAIGARNARSRGLLNVVCASFDGSDFREGVLPAVGLFDVLEHVADGVEFLRRVRAKLRPGGKLYLTVPAFGWLWSEEDVIAGHVRRFDRAALVGILEEAGYLVDHTSYFFRWLVLPILVMRVVLRRGRATPVKGASPRDHALPSGPLGFVVESLLARERRAVSRGRRIPFGSSLIAAATVPRLSR